MSYNDKYPDMSAMYAVQFEYENKLKDKIKELETELERTRKALDVAVDALNTIKGKHDPRCAVYHIDEKTAYDALEQITALEQKEDVRV